MYKHKLKTNGTVSKKIASRITKRYTCINASRLNRYNFRIVLNTMLFSTCVDYYVIRLLNIHVGLLHFPLWLDPCFLAFYTTIESFYTNSTQAVTPMFQKSVISYGICLIHYSIH